MLLTKSAMKLSISATVQNIGAVKNRHMFKNKLFVKNIMHLMLNHLKNKTSQKQYPINRHNIVSSMASMLYISYHLFRPTCHNYITTFLPTDNNTVHISRQI